MSTNLPSTQETEPLLGNDDGQATYNAITTSLSDTEAPIHQTTTTQVSGRALIKFVIPLTIGVFLSAMDGTIIVSSYAAIGSEFNQLQNTSWIATGYMLTLTSFQPLYGKLSDIFGRKPCLLSAYIIFAIGCLLCGLARNMTELIVARAIAGIGGGGMTTIVSIIMSDIVPLRSRGTWQGLINIVWSSGAALGAPLGGLMTDSIGWRWAFLVQVPAVVGAIIAVSVCLKLPKASEGEFWSKVHRIDFAGAFTLVMTVFSLLFALDRGGNIGWSDRLTVTALAAFVVFFLLFAVVEMELAKEPFAPRRIIVNRSLIASYLCNLFGVASALTTVFHISLYLQAVLGMSPHSAGMYILPSVVAGVTGSLGGGLVIQSTGDYYWITIAGYLTLVVGSLLTVFSAGAVVHSLPALIVGFVLSSLGNGGGITTSLIALIANAGPEDQAIATAVSYLFRSCGSVVGLSVGSTLVQDTLRSQLRRRLKGVDDVDYIVRRVRESLTSIDDLEPSTRAIVLDSYEQAILVTFWFSVSMAVCAFLSSLFIKGRSLKSS